MTDALTYRCQYFKHQTHPLPPHLSPYDLPLSLYFLPPSLSLSLSTVSRLPHLLWTYRRTSCKDLATLCEFYPASLNLSLSFLILLSIPTVNIDYHDLLYLSPEGGRECRLPSFTSATTGLHFFHHPIHVLIPFYSCFPTFEVTPFVHFLHFTTFVIKPFIPFSYFFLQTQL